VKVHYDEQLSLAEISGGFLMIARLITKDK